VSEEKSIRVLLVDDHQMVRQGLIFFLSYQPGIEVVGQAGDGEEAIKLADLLKPDVVLMDIVMPEMDGLSALEIIKTRHPNSEVLVLTSFMDDEKVISAIQRGAAGYLKKDVSPPELTRAIKAAARGEVYLHPEASRSLAQSMRPQFPQEPHPDILTERELEVLKLIARGLRNQDIADDLSVSLKTIKVHVSNILAKLELDSRVQAALYALRHNIVELE